jgi:hypothetical protein
MGLARAKRRDLEEDHKRRRNVHQLADPSSQDVGLEVDNLASLQDQSARP